MSRIEVSPSGWVVVEETDRGFMLPVQAVADYAHLLGLSNAVDAMEAFVHWRKHDLATPEPMGDHEWTEVYEVEAHLEQVREDEARRALDEATGGDPEALVQARVPVVRGAWAVRDELTRITGRECTRGESLLGQCQSSLRQKLDCEGFGAPPTVWRSSGITCEAGCPSEAGRSRELSDEDRAELAGKLAPWLPVMSKLKAMFCHRLTGRPDEDDPLLFEWAPLVRGDAQEEAPEPEDEPATKLERIMREYQGVAS